MRVTSETDTVQGEIPAQTELIAHRAFPKGRAARLKRLGPDGSRSVLPPPRTLSALIGAGAFVADVAVGCPSECFLAHRSSNVRPLLILRRFRCASDCS